MAEVLLEMEEQLAQYMQEKGFAEIFKRTVKGKCSEIAKVAIKRSTSKTAEEIAEMATQAIKSPAITAEELSVFKTDLLKKIDPQGVRRELAKLGKGQMQNSNMLRDMSLDVKSIYSLTSSVQSIAWLNSALSVANLAASVVGTVIISKKLNKIDAKLDRISQQLRVVDQKLDGIGAHLDEMEQTLARIESNQEKSIHAQFVTTIKKPCREIRLTYAEISDRISRAELIPKEDVTGFINLCVAQIETILEVEYDYPKWKWDMLGLLSDILPAMTDMIVYFHKYYYDPKSVKGTMCQNWMGIYDKLSSEKFLTDMKNSLYLDQRMHNGPVQETVDCIFLIVQGFKRKILQTVDDIETCDSAKKYREYDNFSHLYALQQAKTMEAQMKVKYGEGRAEMYLEPAKKLNMFAEVM